MDAEPIAGVEQPPSARWALVGLILFAVLVRGGALWQMHDSLQEDPDGYRLLAEGLVQSHGADYRDDLGRKAYRPPLYPLLLAATGSHQRDSTTTLALVHLLLGVGTVWLTATLGRRFRMGNLGLAAAALVACDPILIHQSTLVMTESLATLMAVVFLHCLTSVARRTTAKGAAVAAVAAAMAVLCRPTFLVVALLAPWLLLRYFSTSQLQIKAVATYFLAGTVTLSPWIAKNFVQMGVPVITTTHGGYTLLLGNNPHFYRYLRDSPWGSVWDSAEFQRDWKSATEDIRSRSDADSGNDGDENSNELSIDRAAYRQAWQNVRAEPAMFFYSCLVRFGRFWGLVPHQLLADESGIRRAARYLVGLWYFLEFALAINGLRRLGTRMWRSPWLWAVTLAVTFAAVHTVYWSNMRMRAPVMPVVVMLAAHGAAPLWRCRRKS